MELHARVGLEDLAVVAMQERWERRFLPSTKHVLSPFACRHSFGLRDGASPPGIRTPPADMITVAPSAGARLHRCAGGFPFSLPHVPRAKNRVRPAIARAVRRPLAEVDGGLDAAPTGALDLLERTQARKVRDDDPDRIRGGSFFLLPEAFGVHDDDLGVPADASGCSAGFALAPQAAIARIPAALEVLCPFGQNWRRSVIPGSPQPSPARGRAFSREVC